MESPFTTLGLGTDAAQQFKRVENEKTVIQKRLLVTRQRSRRLNAPGLLTEVAHGVEYVNGVRVKEPPGKATA